MLFSILKSYCQLSVVWLVKRIYELKVIIFVEM